MLSMSRYCITCSPYIRLSSSINTEQILNVNKNNSSLNIEWTCEHLVKTLSLIGWVMIDWRVIFFLQILTCYIFMKCFFLILHMLFYLGRKPFHKNQTSYNSLLTVVKPKWIKYTIAVIIFVRISSHFTCGFILSTPTIFLLSFRTASLMNNDSKTTELHWLDGVKKMAFCHSKQSLRWIRVFFPTKLFIINVELVRKWNRMPKRKTHY